MKRGMRGMGIQGNIDFDEPTGGFNDFGSKPI
jgi:hypothetical protein